MPGRDIIVVGASAGGVQSLQELAAELPADLPAAVFVVLHMPAGSSSVLPRLLARKGPLPALAPDDNMPIEPGRIYVASPNCHLLVQPGKVRVVHGPKENRHRPAVDPLFRSAAWAYGPRVVGVVLSGTLDDGSAGLWAIKSCGGIAVVQDPEDALHPGMPESALAHLTVDHRLPISDIGPLLSRLAREPVNGHRPVTPELVKLETNLVMNGENSDALWSAGRPSPFTCPACHGTLWELIEGDMFRYRCHIGHAFSPESLQAEQTLEVENALGSALRALKEKREVARRLADRFDPKMQSTARKYREEGEELDSQARVIRELLSLSKSSEE